MARISIRSKNRTGSFCEIGKLKIIKSYQMKGQAKEEEIMELELPLSTETIKQLNNGVQNAIKKKKSTKLKSI